MTAEIIQQGENQHQNSCSSWKNREKLMIVPYIRRPPTIDMIIAGIWMIPQCASSVGSAAAPPWSAQCSFCLFGV